MLFSLPFCEVVDCVVLWLCLEGVVVVWMVLWERCVAPSRLWGAVEDHTLVGYGCLTIDAL